MLQQYKVLKKFAFRGVVRNSGDIIELDDSKYTKLVSLGLGDKVQKVGVETVDTLPKKTMSQYKVTSEFELDGVSQVVESVVELTDEQAVELAGNVVKVEEVV